MVLPLLILGSGIGCGGTKVLLNQSGALVRAGPDMKGKVYQWDGETWVLSSNCVQIPEGWYIGPIE